MLHRFLLCMALFALVVSLASSAQPAQNYDRAGENWDWSYGSDEGGGGSSYLGVDIADVSAERLGELKLKEEHGAEVTMVDQDAPAGKAGLHEHDVIVSLNGTAVESAAQLRRMIKETPPGRIVKLGISRDGAAGDDQGSTGRPSQVDDLGAEQRELQDSTSRRCQICRTSICPYRWWLSTSRRAAG